jgi:hypothetical protein
MVRHQASHQYKTGKFVFFYILFFEVSGSRRKEKDVDFTREPHMLNLKNYKQDYPFLATFAYFLCPKLSPLKMSFS